MQLRWALLSPRRLSASEPSILDCETHASRGDDGGVQPLTDKSRPLPRGGGGSDDILPLSTLLPLARGGVTVDVEIVRGGGGAETPRHLPRGGEKPRPQPREGEKPQPLP